MKNHITILLIAIAAVVTCNLPQDPDTLTAQRAAVSISLTAEALAKSTYKLTISGNGMKTIGPNEYAGGQTVELFVPPGTGRVFRLERYDSNTILIDSGTTQVDIAAGMNVVSVSLISAIPTYQVTFNGNSNTGGTVPSLQTKTRGVALTLASNSGNLVKTGFVFAGWNTTADGNGTSFVEGGSFSTDTITTLFAKWTPLPTYTVTYDGNGNTNGTVPSPQTKTHGVVLELAANPPDLVKMGFWFTGWNTSADGTGTHYNEGVNYTADANVTLYSDWIAQPTYTITYDGNSNTGGTSPSPQTKMYGIALTLAVNTGTLVKTGYTFTGWNTAAEGSGTSFAEGGSYTTDTVATLYAKWTALPTYMVGYNGNSNTGGAAPSPQIKIQKVALTLASNTGNLIKAGCTFTGWNTAANGSGIDYSEGGSYMADTITILYAKWTLLPTSTVMYIGNGHHGGTVPPPQTKIQGIVLMLASNTGNLVKTGFTFAGWNTASDGGGADFAEGGSCTADTIDTLFAKWTALPTYAVVYDGNINSGGTTPSPQVKTRGIALTLASNTGSLTKTGFTFAGWNTATDGNGTDYAEGGTYTADTAITLYAKWTDLPTYVITYNGNNQTEGTVPPTQVKTQGVNLLLAQNTGNLGKTGFMFSGWNTSADGSGTDYPAGGKYTADSAITLYVKWAVLTTYTITYEGNNNTGGTVPAVQIKTEKISAALASNTENLLRDGYTFEGWNTAPDGSGTRYAEGGIYTVDANLTLYATWVRIPTYTVMYLGNNNTGGNAPSPQTKTKAIALTLASSNGILTRTGYSFSGWNTAPDGSGTDYAEGGSYTIDADLTLYSKWTPLPTYTVTYDGNSNSSGMVPSSQSKIQGIALTLASNTGILARTGYNFTGWNTAANGTGTDYAEGGSYTTDAGITLYAKWVSRCSAPNFPEPASLTYSNEKLPDPFRFYNGTAVTSKEDWSCRRKEILSMAEKYLYGPMPPDPDQLTTTVNTNSIGVMATVGSKTSTLNFSTTGSGDILCIKIGGVGISPSSARILNFDPTNSKTAIANLFGMSNITGTIATAWAVKLICTAIEQNPANGISSDKIMVTGCSGAAKVAMTTGAFCEGIDLTVIVESGGGGGSSFRMAEWFRHGAGGAIWNCSDGPPQGIDNLETNGLAGPWVSTTAASWLISSPSKIKNLPIDQHLVLACIAPRPVCHVTNQNGTNEWCLLGTTCEALSAWAAEPVWNALGVPANFGFLIYTESSTPGHCANPASATGLAQQFFNRVFSGNTTAATDVMIIQDSNIQQPFADWQSMWVDWNMNPTLN